ncbi:MAG TPA: polymorphic toxin type 46 domain-containing protein, partial [Polyangiaceae bacterium]|nr:polymorphic toxin type 46 domain-containing protein [Polyangiaceae bacterium]
TVFIGKEAGTYLPIEEELPGWMVATAEWAVRIGGYLTLAGTAILSGVLVAGVGYFVGDWASSHGKDWLGAAGERLFGERGKIVGEFVGEQGASFLAGKALGKVEGHLMTVEAAGARRVLASNPELAARLATTRGANPLQIAARQNVAAEHYRSTTSYAEFEKGYRGRPGKEGATDAQVQKAYGREINSHLAGIDFRQPVHVETIPAETKLYTYNTPGAEHAGSYFTREPTPPTKIGISENKTYTVDGQSVTAPRELYTVTTKSEVQALVSTAAPKLDNWSVKTFDADGNASPVVAESKGGAEQININTARNPENGPTQGDVFADGQQGVLTSTGQTSRDYADPTTNQASDLTAPKEYKWAPIAGDSAIIGKGTTPLPGDGSGDGGAP